MNLRDIAEVIGKALREKFAPVEIRLAALEQLEMRLAALERRIAAIPAGRDGKDGAPGADGKSGDRGEKGLDGANGNDGRDGKDGAPGADGKSGDRGEKGLDGANGNDGRDGKDGAPGADGSPGDRGEKGLDGANGNDGRDGKDGAPGADGRHGERGKDGLDAAAIVPVIGIDETRRYREGTWAAFNGGTVRAMRDTDPLKGSTLSNAGWAVMHNGLAAVVFTQGEDPRDFIFSLVLTDGTTGAVTRRVPMPLYQGVFSTTKSYWHGDIVTWGGSMWHKGEQGNGEPGAEGSGWTLCVKKGQPGKDAIGKSGGNGPLKL